MARMLGVPAGEVIDANVFRPVHEDDVLTFKDSFSKGLSKPGVPMKHAFRLRDRNISGVTLKASA